MKTTKIVEVDTKEYKAIANKYKDKLKDRMTDGRFVITNPTFDDIDTIVLVEVKDKMYQELGSGMTGAEKYVLITKDNESVARGIMLAQDMSGKYKDKAPEMPSIVDAKGEEVIVSNVSGKLLAKRLGDEPANHLTPYLYSKIIRDEFAEFENVTVNVIGQRDLEEMGMNTLLSVGAGSDEDSYVVVMEYRGVPTEDITTAFVGKGVTFDTGGISLKPGAKMHEMKLDMCGSAAVVGAIKNLAGQKAKVNVVGVVGLVENMPSGKATKPGDVVTSLSGQTVENHNTDAEGRLVLCDCLTYVQNTYSNVNKIVDLATLTGAILVSLADEYAGLFTNSTELSDAISSSKEKFWRMPMGKVFAKQLESNVADMKNLGNGHPGSTTAAEFLYKFVDKDIAWAHLDIAGTASKGGKATGFGVDTLVDFALQYSKSNFKVDEDMKY